ncbi:hypothetical protein ABPG74_015202 [Tetrahymena malaccensis]
MIEEFKIVGGEDNNEEISNHLKISPKKIPNKVIRKPSMHYVRSRDELLEEENQHFESLRKKYVKTRRTKIVGTISSFYSSYENLKSMVEAGLNSFMVNMAYCTPDLLVTLRKHRDALEKEFDIQLPITCVLKGTLVRIGTLQQPEIFLKKGQEYRIVLNHKVLGNNLYCAVDDKDIIRRVKVGNQILIDYGQISMTIIRIEKSDQSLKILREQNEYKQDDFLETFTEKKKRFYPNLYFGRESSSDQDNPNNGSIFSEDDIRAFNSQDNIDDSFSSSQISQTSQNKASFKNACHSTQQLDQSGNNNKQSQFIGLGSRKNIQITENQNIPEKYLQNPNSPSKDTPKYLNSIQQSTGNTNQFQNKFAEQLRQKKQGKKKIYDVIVCQVDSDCLIKSYKPIFIYEKDYNQKKDQLRKYRHKNLNNDMGLIDSIGEQLSEDDERAEDYEGEECITPKDITDINHCINNDIDCICVSNVRSARDIKAVRNLIGEDRGVRIMAKIQTPESVENFEEIVKASDGVQIARGYLTVHMPVEKLFAKQKEMIHKCHEHLKPVLVSCNILDSMVSSLLPTMCEVGEISNLVNDYVDNIVLSSETSCGNHPVQAIKTLSRICVEAEALRIMKRLQNPSHSDIVSIKSQSNAIPCCIINCSLEAAYQVHASVIMVFTTRGYTALKLSKLRPPCPIIAVTCHKKVARNLSSVSAVNSILFGSLIGTEVLIQKVIDKLKLTGLVKVGDFIVITSGDIENLANQTNNLRIYTVQ